MKYNEYTWKHIDRKGNTIGFITVAATSRNESASISGIMDMKGKTPGGRSVLWKVNGRRVYSKVQ